MNLLNLLKEAIGDQFVEQASSFIGESKENTAKASSAIFPSILGGLVQKGKDSNGSERIIDFLNSHNIAGEVLDNLEDQFSGGEQTNHLIDNGTAILEMIFGHNSTSQSTLVDIVSSVSGVRKGSASSLMKMAAPLVMGIVGKKVKEMGIGKLGLRDMLLSQKDDIKEGAPEGVFAALGFDTVIEKAKEIPNKAEAVTTVQNKVEEVEVTPTEIESGKSVFSRVLPWVILLSAALGLFYLMRGGSDRAEDLTETDADQAETIAEEKNAPEANIPKKQESNSSKKIIQLPTGSEISTNPGSFTDKIARYLAGDEFNSDMRFTFDQVSFESEGAEITPGSLEQLQNFSSLLKAYPQVNFRIEGHTDNSGEEEADKALSSQRAFAVKRSLNEMGIANERMVTAGFGQEKPIADNSTEQGRALNSRIDIYITQK